MMKKILGVFMCLTLMGRAYEPYAKGGGTGNILEKNQDYIKIGFTMWTDQFDAHMKDEDQEKIRSIAISHCASHNKFAFNVDNYLWQDKPYKYLCRKNPRSINLSDGKKIAWTNFNIDSGLNMQNMVEEVKSYCAQIGLNPGTDKYADCSIKLLTAKIESQKQIVQQVNSGMSGTVTIKDPNRDTDLLMKRSMGLIMGTCTTATYYDC